MTKNLPTGPELLAIARETLLKEVLPRASGDTRYALLMIANAMAIAAREAQAPEPVRFEVDDGTLARQIRQGRYDVQDAEQAAMLAYLRESVMARLRISNPKAIERPDAPRLLRHAVPRNDTSGVTSSQRSSQ